MSHRKNNYIKWKWVSTKIQFRLLYLALIFQQRKTELLNTLEDKPISAAFGSNLNPNLLNLKNVIQEPSLASSNLDHLLNFGRSIEESFAQLSGFKLLKPKLKPLRPSGNHGTLENQN